MKDIADVDYRHVKKLSKNFNNENLGGCYDLYVQSDTLLIADVFENFRNNIESNIKTILKYMNLILLIFYQHLD